MRVYLALQVILSIFFALTVDGGGLLSKLQSMAGGVSSLTANETIIYDIRHPNDRYCLAVHKSSILKCFSPTNEEIITINYIDAGMHALEVVNLSANSVQQMDLLVTLGNNHHTLDSQISIDNPAYGSLITKKLSVSFHRTGSEPADSIHVDMAGMTHVTVGPDTPSIESQHREVEPGSIFLTLTPQAHGVDAAGQERVLSGSTAYGYLEAVLSPEDIKLNRRYANYPAHSHSSLNTPQLGHQSNDESVNVQTNVPTKPKPARNTPVNICVFSGPKLDGQKQIWVQQSLHMSRTKYHFTWLVHLDAHEVHNPRTSANPVVQSIAHMGHITIAPNHNYMLNLTELSEMPADGRTPMSEIYNGDTSVLYKYAHESLVHAKYVIEDVTPKWCRGLYLNMQRTLLSQGCEVVVYGNQGSGSADVVILDTARVLGIPTVVELQNLYVDAHAVPTVLVAPSMYAAEHESIQSGIRAHLANINEYTRSVADVESVVVIPPSVDSDVFDSSRFSSDEMYRHPACVVTGETVLKGVRNNSPCIVIAFVARLAPEKNPGLFLQAAYEILQVYPFARFTIIGDGVLRGPLEDLAARLQISWAMHFTGWASGADLPALLAGVDIVINPSLRAWSETFCIANIEVMSMAVPLVTFAVGGIGEYVQDPALSTDHSSSSNDSSGDFSVSANAVVVHRATSEALARAALHLIRRPALRRALGQSGRQTVVAHFNVQQQMAQYEELYDKLVV